MASAFKSYQATRGERTARVQLTSRQNTWGKQAEDTRWVYGYDAWQTPLARPEMQAPANNGSAARLKGSAA